MRAIPDRTRPDAPSYDAAVARQRDRCVRPVSGPLAGERPMFPTREDADRLALSYSLARGIVAEHGGGPC